VQIGGLAEWIPGRRAPLGDRDHSQVFFVSGVVTCGFEAAMVAAVPRGLAMTDDRL
jgi:hypothetical protein